jgi:SIT family siderophore-iron:H+ symporter-like MFS transporter
MSNAEHTDSGLEKRTTLFDANHEQTDTRIPYIDPNSTVAKSTAKSIGIRKAEALSDQYTHPVLRIILFVSIFCASYCYSLDGTIRYTFQGYATASYLSHSLLATVNVIRAVVAAAAQPTYARLSDVFGRLELLVVSIIFYAMGTVIESQAYDINRFAGGAVLYQIGYSGVIVMFQIILADFSNMNWRMLASFIPGLPFIINTWISGNVSSELLASHSWNYSIGIWAFIFPLSCVPVLACFVHMYIRARKTPEWALLKEEEREIRRNFQGSWFKRMWGHLVFLFWHLDVVGILFIICIFGFILVPFTIAGGVSDTWKQGKIIAPLVIGFVLIPFFLLWQAKVAKHPVLPLNLVKDRGVWASLIVGIFINWVWYMPNDFMYTVLVVGMRASIKAATRITSLYSFVSVITGTIVGFVVVYFRRVKPFIIFGVCMWFISMGLLLHFRGDNDGVQSEKYLNGVIGSLCLMGFGAGFFTYATQVSIAACTNHEYMAIVISIYLASYNIGSAFGSSISGAMWSNLMYKQILKNFRKHGLSETAAALAYSTPYSSDPTAPGFIEQYVWGTPERIQVVLAYAHVQRLLCIVGLCLVVPLFFATLCLRDHKLESVQSLELEHGDAGVKDKDGEVILNNYDDDIIIGKLKGLFKRNKNN